MKGAHPSYTLTTSLIEAMHRRSNEKDLNFNDYINFLVDSALIGFNDQEDLYYLTVLGYEFLEYLNQNGIFDKSL